MPTPVSLDELEKLLWADKCAEAEKLCKETIRGGVTSAELYAFLGDVCSHQGKWEDKEAAYREAVRLDPDNTVYRNILGYTFLHHEKWEEAEESYRAAFWLDPDKVNYNMFGYACYRQGKWKEAEQAYRAAVGRNPDTADHHNALGDACSRQEKWEEAEEAYREAVRLDPDHAGYRNDLGIAYLEQEKWEEAEGAFREAVRLSPDYAPYRNNLGIAYLKQEKLVAAETYFQRALTDGHEAASLRLEETRDKLRPLYEQMESFVKSGPKSALKDICSRVINEGFISLSLEDIEVIEACKPTDAEKVIHGALCGALSQLPGYAVEARGESKDGDDARRKSTGSCSSFENALINAGFLSCFGDPRGRDGDDSSEAVGRWVEVVDGPSDRGGGAEGWGKGS
jgi:tetratricopeptide (TPR) repeat protein